MPELKWFEILMALASFALMAVTVVVAVVAIFGWTYIRAGAEKAAKEIAEKTLKDFLANENIREMIREAAAEEAASLYGDMDRSPTHDLSDLTKKETKQ